MSENKSTDSLKNIIVVTFVVCLFCAIVVSIASVSLRPLQLLNAQLEIKRNVLSVLGFKSDVTEVIEDKFSNLTVNIINLDTGAVVEDANKESFSVKEQLKQEGSFIKLSAKEDIASIRKRENMAKVFLAYKDGKISNIILPIRGYGLWSTLYGYIALESDFNTISGISFYQHAETPGLGGEVDNEKWKKQWIGKKIYDEKQSIAFKLVKGGVQGNDNFAVDALSGASLTSRGVENLIHFWFGKYGFASYIQTLK